MWTRTTLLAADRCCWLPLLCGCWRPVSASRACCWIGMVLMAADENQGCVHNPAGLTSKQRSSKHRLGRARAAWVMQSCRSCCCVLSGLLAGSRAGPLGLAFWAGFLGVRCSWVVAGVVAVCVIGSYLCRVCCGASMPGVLHEGASLALVGSAGQAVVCHCLSPPDGGRCLFCLYQFVSMYQLRTAEAVEGFGIGTPSAWQPWLVA
jgi:hypothetical protein